MDEQKKMFTNKSVTLFLVIVISVSAIFETIVIALSVKPQTLPI